MQRIPINETINREKAIQLFKEHAILFELNDAVPVKTVTELLGNDAVKHVIESDKSIGKHWNKYYIQQGDKYTTYLKISGFCMACTYHNVHATGTATASVKKE